MRVATQTHFILPNVYMKFLFAQISIFGRTKRSKAVHFINIQNEIDTRRILKASNKNFDYIFICIKVIPRTVKLCRMITLYHVT